MVAGALRTMEQVCFRPWYCGCSCYWLGRFGLGVCRVLVYLWGVIFERGVGLLLPPARTYAISHTVMYHVRKRRSTIAHTQVEHADISDIIAGRHELEALKVINHLRNLLVFESLAGDGPSFPGLPTPNQIPPPKQNNEKTMQRCWRSSVRASLGGSSAPSTSATTRSGRRCDVCLFVVRLLLVGS